MALFWGWVLSIPMHRSYVHGYTHTGEDALMVFSTAMVGLHAIALFLAVRRRSLFAATSPVDAAVMALVLLVGVPMFLIAFVAPVLGT
ncbi:MAG: hypothetical protein AAFV77_12205 [Planctomycetota bacterium]